MTDKTDQQRSKAIPALMARWRKKTNQPMPLDIAQLSLEKIKLAVRLIERGDVVAVPKSLSLGNPSRQIDISDDSLMDWDRNSEN
jgi:hypothetical protein